MVLGIIIIQVGEQIRCHIVDESSMRFSEGYAVSTVSEITGTP